MSKLLNGDGSEACEFLRLSVMSETPNLTIFSGHLPGSIVPQGSVLEHDGRRYAVSSFEEDTLEKDGTRLVVIFCKQLPNEPTE